METWLYIFAFLAVVYLYSAISDNSKRAEEIKQRLKQIRLNTEENNRILLSINRENERLEKEKAEIEYLYLSFETGYKEFAQSYLSGRQWLADMFAELAEIHDEMVADKLSNKKPPALKAADEVRKINREKRQSIRQARLLEYQLKLYHEKFPVLFDNEEDILNEEINSQTDIEQTDELRKQDPSRIFLSAEEYRRLPPADRNQLALDRYLEKHHSKAAIGKMYERYIGYLYEQQGYKVEFHGILKGYEDLGRDLICTKGREILIIQAKNWSAHKQIRENHICQLFGTSIHYKKHHPEANIKMLLITATVLSDIAKEMAQALQVKFIENEKLDKNYPMIKCNINHSTGEKIYHLPFDQLYDRVQIKPGTGEMYVRTVFEAEFHGFRRAHRWRGNH